MPPKRGPGDLSRSTQYRLKRRAFESSNSKENDSSSSSSDSEREAAGQPVRRAVNEEESDGDEIENGSESEENGHDSSNSQRNTDGDADTEENAESDHSDGGQAESVGEEQEMENVVGGDGAGDAENDFQPPNQDEANNFLQQPDINGEDSDESGSETDSDTSSNDSSSEDTSDSDSEDEEEGMDGDVPLYANARLSVMESVMSILTLALRFSLTGECITRILETIELHCPTPNQCITSLYRFKNFFKEIGRETLVLHYFCETCFAELAGKDSVCINCEDTQVAFFIEIPLINQLQRLFMRPGFIEKLLYRFQRQKQHANNLEDIYDGNLYKELVVNNGILSGRYNLSFTWYSDGIQIFKSVKYAVWPLFFVINELSYKQRTSKENVILSGLWFGKSKPKPNLFLKPFRDTFQTFKDEGFEFNIPGGAPINVKGILICGTCDLQAKGIFLRTKMYNGYFGCNRCLSAGVRVPAGRTTVHAHPYVAPQNMQLRNIGEVLPCVRIAHETGTPYLGYRGLSLLYFMMVDMIRGCPVDIMHSIFLGISKLLMRLWFDSKYNGEVYSCHQLTATVNAKLLKICPPSFVQRMTRTIDEIKLWKAKEYKLWFFYYSIPVLDGILERVYLVHHMKLVSAIALLCQESIFPDQLTRAEGMLNEYVRDFERLYGLRYMGMNVHLLLHLVDVVRDLGPLWVYSCFFFEDLNGQLVKLIHGPHQPGIQICSSASVFMSFKLQLERLQPDSLVKMFCVNVQDSTCKLKIVEQITAKMFVVGHNSVRLNVSNEDINIIRNQVEGCNGGHFQSFTQIRKSGVVLCCADRTTRKKRCSHFACFNVNNTPTLGKIKKFVRWSNCMCNTICQCQPAKFLCIFQVYDRIQWHAHNVPRISIFHLAAVAPTQTEIVVPCDLIMSVCFYIELDNAMFLGTPVNRLEYE